MLVVFVRVVKRTVVLKASRNVVVAHTSFLDKHKLSTDIIENIVSLNAS